MPSLRRRVRISRTFNTPTPKLCARKMGTGPSSQKEPQNAHFGNSLRLPRNGCTPSEIHKGHKTLPTKLTAKEPPHFRTSITPYITLRITPLPPPPPPLPPQRCSARQSCADASTHSQEPKRNTNGHRHDGHLARVNRARQLEVESLRIDSFIAMGVEHRIVMTLVHITTHTVRYTFPKCYMGLCFPKRTVMDSKKKKSVVSSQLITPYELDSSHNS